MRESRAMFQEKETLMKKYRKVGNDAEITKKKGIKKQPGLWYETPRPVISPILALGKVEWLWNTSKLFRHKSNVNEFWSSGLFE